MVRRRICLTGSGRKGRERQRAGPGPSSSQARPQGEAFSEGPLPPLVSSGTRLRGSTRVGGAPAGVEPTPPRRPVEFRVVMADLEADTAMLNQVRTELEQKR